MTGQGINVLALFDGISCGRVALARAGIPVDRYVAYEIDRNAVRCSAANWPDIEHKGDVAAEKDWAQYRDFDLLLAGPPCTDLSIAGKRAGLDGAHSSLFWVMHNALKTSMIPHFLVENVASMGAFEREIITAAMGVEPIRINSSLVSAQRRDRLYWCSWPNDRPADRHIMLSDVLDDRLWGDGLTATQWRRCLTPGMYGYTAVVRMPADKSNTLTAMYKTMCSHGVICHGDNCRRLHPDECERLQTLPTGYTAMLAKTARYKAIGNGWTVDVIAHLLDGYFKTVRYDDVY
jgi:DNA (cytosine-5)-methyltransferase 3A